MHKKTSAHFTLPLVSCIFNTFLKGLWMSHDDCFTTYTHTQAHNANKQYN